MSDPKEQRDRVRQARIVNNKTQNDLKSDDAPQNDALQLH